MAVMEKETKKVMAVTKQSLTISHPFIIRQIVKKELLDLLSQTEKLYFTLFPNNQQLQNDPATERAKEILSILQQENAEPMLLKECNDFITSLIIRNKPFDLLKQAVRDFFKLATSKAGLNADFPN